MNRESVINFITNIPWFYWCLIWTLIILFVLFGWGALVVLFIASGFITFIAGLTGWIKHQDYF